MRRGGVLCVAEDLRVMFEQTPRSSQDSGRGTHVCRGQFGWFVVCRHPGPAVVSEIIFNELIDSSFRLYMTIYQ